MPTFSAALYTSTAKTATPLPSKVDKTDIRHIIATFERFEYEVKAYFEETDLGEIYKDRFDSLMNYLNI